MNAHDTAPVWRKSLRCDNEGCVEVARLATGVALRDSSLCDGPTLTFSREEWAAFVTDVRAEHWRSPRQSRG